MRSVENEECGKCGVWKMRSVENAQCIKKGYKKILSYLGSQFFMQNKVKALLSGNERTDRLKLGG